MSRFYYRPVDPGYAEMGRGLGSGLERGVAGFYGQRDNEEQRRRAEEEDAWAQVMRDQWLLERGGGRGEAPEGRMEEPPPMDPKRAGGGAMGMPGMESRQPRGGETRSPAFGAGGMAEGAEPADMLARHGGLRGEGPADLMRRHGGVVGGGRATGRGGERDDDAGMRQAPSGSRPSYDDAMMRRPDGPARYVPVGPEGYGYVENPEFTARQQAEAAEAQRARQIGDAAAALLGHRDDIDRGRVKGSAMMLVDDLASYPQLFPEQDEPDPYDGRDRAQWLADLEDELRLRERYGRGSGTGRDRNPTYAQAYDRLVQMYPGEFEGETSLDPDMIHDLATRMSRGEQVEFPERAGGPEPEPEPGVMVDEPGIGGFLARVLPGGSPGVEAHMPPVGARPPAADAARAPGARPPAPRPSGPAAPAAPGEGGAPMMDEASVQAVRRELERFPRRQWRQILEEEGASEAEIRLILGEG